MNPEIPPGIDLENVFLVEVRFMPDAAERRPAQRHEHLLRIAELIRNGTLILGGAYTDQGLSSSVLVIRAADAEAAMDVIREDVYSRTGVWEGMTVRPFSRVVLSADAG